MPSTAWSRRPGSDWRDVAMVRALGRYLRQVARSLRPGLPGRDARPPRSHRRRDRRACSTRASTRGDRRPRPHRPRRRSGAEIEDGLRAVTSLDEDRILRRFVNLVEAALRTNFFQLDAERAAAPDDRLQVRMRARSRTCRCPGRSTRSSSIRPRVEGVHLRFGKVARGGLRWSDRPQDFRTEVLGLVKAQQVKNAVIVPVGRQGRLRAEAACLRPSDRQAWLAEGTESYRIFVSTLLQLTDNIEGGEIVRPPIRSGTTGTIPTWSWPPTRARRPSPTSPMRSRSRRVLARRCLPSGG